MAARNHRHTLVRSYQSLPVIMGDRGRLTQVLMNIVGNAIKYTPDGGRIELRGGTEGEEAWLEVSDNGIGILPKTVPMCLSASTAWTRLVPASPAHRPGVVHRRGNRGPAQRHPFPCGSRRPRHHFPHHSSHLPGRTGGAS